MRNKVVLAALLAAALRAQPIDGTRPLARQGDLAMEMVAGMDRYLMRRLDASASRRPAPAADSVARLKRLIGLIDPRIPFDSPALDSTLTRGAVIGTGAGYEILAVRWPVLDGVDGEGLLLRPKAPPVAHVVAVPDADWTPEMLAGLTPGVAAESQFARRLAENGCQVLIPFLINRDDLLSGHPAIRFTNQPHREFLHRMAYEMGRHIIGYEVQKILAGIDWFAGQEPRWRIGVFGYGEGGLLALFAAAVDSRIDATVVSGYFQKREAVVWSEPIYRNIWSQLETWATPSWRAWSRRGRW